MRENIILKLFIPAIIFISIAASGKENIPDEFVIGKLEFISENGREGIVVVNSPDKAYLLNKGILILLKRGSKQIILKIKDADGKYLRCILNSETESTVIKHGEDVCYSEVLNSSIKYRDAKRILAELIKLYENFILKIESTEDPQTISSAVNNFSSDLERLIPEMKRINSRYPELEKFKLSPPAELQSESSMLEVLEPRLKEAFFKIKLYSSDENVKKATENLQKVLIKMNPGR